MPSKKTGKAEFIFPPNLLKLKVGSGGLSQDILQKAQAILENSGDTFLIQAEEYLHELIQAVNSAHSELPKADYGAAIRSILSPSMKLKANGGMFRFPLISLIANELIRFLERLDRLDSDALEIVTAFHTSFHIIVSTRQMGLGGQKEEELILALKEACRRYIKKHNLPAGS